MNFDVMCSAKGGHYRSKGSLKITTTGDTDAQSGSKKSGTFQLLLPS